MTVSDPAILFANLENIRVRAEVDERYASQLKPGMMATLSGRTIGFQKHDAVVTEVRRLMGEKTVFSRTATERKDLETLQFFLSAPMLHCYPLGLKVDVSVRVRMTENGDSQTNLTLSE